MIIAALIAAIIGGLVLGVLFAVVVSHQGQRDRAADGGTTASGLGGTMSTSSTGTNVPAGAESGTLSFTTPPNQRPVSSLSLAQASGTVSQESSSTTSDPSQHPALLSVQDGGRTAQETTGHPTSTKLDPNPSSDTQIPTSSTPVLLSGSGKFGWL